jgi:hypothetical protein
LRLNRGISTGRGRREEWRKQGHRSTHPNAMVSAVVPMENAPQRYSTLPSVQAGSEWFAGMTNYQQAHVRPVISRVALSSLTSALAPNGFRERDERWASRRAVIPSISYCTHALRALCGRRRGMKLICAVKIMCGGYRSGWCGTRARRGQVRTSCSSTRGSQAWGVTPTGRAHCGRAFSMCGANTNRREWCIHVRSETIK